MGTDFSRAREARAERLCTPILHARARSARRTAEGGRKLILILQNQNNDSEEFRRITNNDSDEIDSDSRIKIMILESIAH